MSLHECNDVTDDLVEENPDGNFANREDPYLTTTRQQERHPVVSKTHLEPIKTVIMKLSAIIFLIPAVSAFQSSFGGARLAGTRKFSSSTDLCMKTIAVFGASGLTASECVYQALQNGDNVVGLARTPSNLKIPKGSGGSNADKALTDPKLKMIAGDVTKKADVDKVFEQDIDGVVVALGGKTADVGETMLTDGTKNVIAAMKEKGVKRLAVVTSIGAGDSKDQAPFFFKILMMTAMKKIFNDKNNQEKVVTESGLEYCIVRPGGLTVDRKCTHRPMYMFRGSIDLILRAVLR